MWPFKKKNNMEKQKLSWLIRGIMSAVQSASDIAGQQHLDLIKNYFQINDDGTITPKVINININDKQKMKVPLICMINPSSYKMSSMELEMHARFTNAEIKSASDHIKNECLKSSCMVELGRSKNKNSINIKMKFEAEDDHPEALSRIVEELQNKILSDNNDEYPKWDFKTID
jgi:hypothetical protein